MSHPFDAVTLDEAARILGVARSTVQEWVRAGGLSAAGEPGQHGRLSRADVEQLAAEVYPHRRHHGDPDSYWVTGEDAAALLGVSTQRLRQLVAADRLPFVWHVDNVRLYRREQLLTIANARDARWHYLAGGSLGLAAEPVAIGIKSVRVTPGDVNGFE